MILVALLMAETLVFAVIGHNFLSTGNAFEVSRLSVEIGLLALALTPVIVTGGHRPVGRVAAGFVGGPARQDVA
jgi:ribose/xylose/arabinose/galactoside ABC-type transport system permease subunit